MSELELKDEKVKEAAKMMHASIKAGNVEINFDDLLSKLKDIGLDVGQTTAKQVVDDALFPWLTGQLTKLAAQNMMFGLGLPVVQALQMYVDAQVAKIPQK